jgi:hypothetical protein
MIKYQNYSHYKLPITINPLEYGKLIEQIGNKYIIHLNTFNILIINQSDNENIIKLFRKGEFIFEFKDSKLSENSFVRLIQDQKYIFKNSRLISTEIISVIYKTLICVLYDVTKAIQDFTPFLIKNRIKLYILILLIIILVFHNDIFYQMAAVNIIKLRKTRTRLSNWINYRIRISPSIFTKELIKINLNKFWTNIIEKELKNDQHIIFLFRIQWSDNQFVSIGNLQKLNIEDKDYILNKIVDNMIDKGGYYLEQSIISLVFTYAIRKGKVINTNIQYHNFQHHKLPITMDPLNYGKLIDKIGETYVIQVNPKNIATITQFENSNEVKFYKSAELTYEYTDKWINENTFSRISGKKEWILKNNEQLLFKN